MSDQLDPPEIEFGDLQGRAAPLRLRPDRDGHFAVSCVGKAQPTELPIFVDLDVMRELEAHAHSNTNVELGGVLLGWQARDEEGRPFVQIIDSLRAEHYEATRGSFKFTHETWSEITRRRQKLHPELQLVGWYHTHPGWGVFLSEMDRFICDHFFSAPEDVALVIDPRQQTRGWFQWVKPGATSQLQGWFLTTHRHRQRELDYYSRLYSGAPMPHFDPRYSEPPAAGPTTVQLLDRGSSQTPLIGWLLLGFQTIALCLVAFRLLTLPVAPASAPAIAQDAVPSEAPAGSSDLPSKLEAALARNETYREVLTGFLQAQGQSPDLPQLYADSQLEREQLAVSNRSHASRIAELERMLETQTRRAQQLGADLTAAESQLQLARAAERSASGPPTSLTSSPDDRASSAMSWSAAPWVLPTLLGSLLICLAALVASLIRGARLTRDLERLRLQFRPQGKPDASSTSAVKTARTKPAVAEHPAGTQPDNSASP